MTSPLICPATGGPCTRIACPDHWCREPPFDVRQAVIADYWRKVNDLIRKASAQHKDLAVTPAEMINTGDAYAMQWQYLMLEPGEKPPLGFTWCVYEVGG